MLFFLLMEVHQKKFGRFYLLNSSYFEVSIKRNYFFRLSEINLRLSNLLNEKRYASTMLGDLTRSYSEYRIRPFNAVVEVYYRF